MKTPVSQRKKSIPATGTSVVGLFVVVPLWALIPVAAPSGCAIRNDNGIIDEFDRERKLGNRLTDALGFAQAQRMDETLDGSDRGGPHPDGFFGPTAIIAGQPFTVRLAAARADAARVRYAVLQVCHADTHIRIPVTLDPATGVATVQGVLGTDDGLTGFNHQSWWMLMDEEGRTGNGIPFTVIVHEQGSDPASEMLTIQAHEGSALAVGWTVHGRNILLLSGGQDTNVSIWNRYTGHLIRTLQGHTESVLAVAATSDGTRIASGGQDNTVRIWDTDTGELLHTFGDHLDFVTTVAVSPDDRLVASGSWDHTIRVRDLSDGSLVHTHDAGDRVNAVAFSPGGEYLAAATGRLLHPGGLSVWTVADWSERHAYDFDREVTALAFSDAGDRLAAAVGRGIVHILELPSGGPLHELLDGPNDTIPGLGFWPSDNNFLGTITQTGYATVWDLGQPSIAANRRFQLSLTSAAFSPDGAHFTFGDTTGTVCVLPADDPAQF